MSAAMLRSFAEGYSGQTRTGRVKDAEWVFNLAVQQWQTSATHVDDLVRQLEDVPQSVHDEVTEGLGVAKKAADRALEEKRKLVLAIGEGYVKRIIDRELF